MSASPLTLQYESPNKIAAPNRAWRRITLAAAALGMVVTVVPFAWDISPARAVAEGIAEYVRNGFSSGGFIDLAAVTAFGSVFFLSFPLFAWKIRRLLNRSARRSERVAMFVAGGAGALAFGFVVGRWLSDFSSSNSSDVAVFSCAGAIFCFAATILVVLLIRKRGAGDARFTLALIGPYLASLVLCVIGFSDERDVGWYLSIVPGVVFLIELALITREAMRSSPN